MRWVHLSVAILLAVAAVIFALQNLEMVTMSFLGFSARTPLAVQTIIVYVLGAFTGGSLYALIRRSIQESRTKAS